MAVAAGGLSKNSLHRHIVGGDLINELISEIKVSNIHKFSI